MIHPTIGRVVWYHRCGDTPGTAPWVGLICTVWTDEMVNVAGFNNEGFPFRETAVRLYQEGDGWASGTSWCEWMPFQKGQARQQDLELRVEERK